MTALVLLILAVWLLAAVLVQVARPVEPIRPVSPAPVRRQIRTEVPHLLYCYLWATTLRPRYYGISNEPEARGSRHAVEPKDEWWFRQSTGVMVPIRWYPNRVTARTAERDAVRAGAAAGEDLANDHHNPRRPTRGAIR